MKLTVISDTHGEHEKLGRLSGDVLIHCGDMFNMFSPRSDELERMDDWFGRQDFDLILCVGGNHDSALQNAIKSSEHPFENASVLQDKTHVHDGITFFGAPWVPMLSSHAFYCGADELEEKWSFIHESTDVLITHTPPNGVLDVSSAGLRLGCSYLAKRVRDITPRIHCFGHVHASAGTVHADGTTFVNASMVNSQYELARGPYELEI